MDEKTEELLDNERRERAIVFSQTPNWVTVKHSAEGELTWGFVWDAMAEFAKRDATEQNRKLIERVKELEGERDELALALKKMKGWREGDEDLCECSHPRDQHWNRRDNCDSCNEGVCEAFKSLELTP